MFATCLVLRFTLAFILNLDFTALAPIAENLCGIDAYEPNNARKKAHKFKWQEGGLTIDGGLCKRDQDWHKVKLAPGRYQIRCQGSDPRMIYKLYAPRKRKPNFQRSLRKQWQTINVKKTGSYTLQLETRTVSAQTYHCEMRALNPPTAQEKGIKKGSRISSEPSKSVPNGI